MEDRVLRRLRAIYDEIGGVLSEVHQSQASTTASVASDVAAAPMPSVHVPDHASVRGGDDAAPSVRGGDAAASSIHPASTSVHLPSAASSIHPASTSVHLPSAASSIHPASIPPSQKVAPVSVCQSVLYPSHVSSTRASATTTTETRASVRPPGIKDPTAPGASAAAPASKGGLFSRVMTVRPTEPSVVKPSTGTSVAKPSVVVPSSTTAKSAVSTTNTCSFLELKERAEEVQAPKYIPKTPESDSDGESQSSYSEEEVEYRRPRVPRARLPLDLSSF